MLDVKKEYLRWKENVTEEKDLVADLSSMDENAMNEAFYRDLEFGTAGLRGILGAGTNRMNEYTVGKASQGLANYILKNVKPEERRVAISYDSRLKSDTFAKLTAEVLAAAGIRTFIYPELMPVPCLSFATRELKCAFGVMVTASHNPSKYNGYKVYGNDGCQVIADVADGILNEINNIDIFKDIKRTSFEEGLSNGLVSYIGDDVYTSFIERVKEKSQLRDEKVDKNVKIVYSPLHGAGLKPVTRILKESGYTDIIVVKEQEEPDGHFTTCPYPNPEIREAMSLGIEYAKKNDADLLFATDPDCDRIGIAVKDHNGEFVLVSGNEVGALLLNYICEMKKKHGELTKGATAVKTIVSTDLADAIAKDYGVKLVSVLTGFKYIGEQIAILEKEGRADDFLLGFEESYGYLSGTHARDKDAVNGSFLIVEMFAYYKTQGISLYDKLLSLYEKYGYYTNHLKSYQFEGMSGFARMQEIMTSLREKGLDAVNGDKVVKMLDYKKGVDGLPSANVIKFVLASGCTAIARPSGTEPKLKIYLSIKGTSLEENKRLSEKMFEFFDDLLK